MDRYVFTMALSLSIFPSFISMVHWVPIWYAAMTIAATVPTRYCFVDVNSSLIVVLGMKQYSFQTGYMFIIELFSCSTNINSQSPQS